MPMKLILREDVENLGHLGDIVNVKPGYGRNFLIPRGMAMPATESNMRVFELERRKLEEKMNKVRSEAQVLAQKIAGVELVIPVRVGEGGKLYGSVTTAMLADQLAELGVELDRKKIVLENPLRSLGEFSVPVKLHAATTAELKVKVVDQDRGELEEDEPVAEQPEEVSEPEIEG